MKVNLGSQILRQRIPNPFYELSPQSSNIWNVQRLAQVKGFQWSEVHRDPSIYECLSVCQWVLWDRIKDWRESEKQCGLRRGHLSGEVDRTAASWKPLWIRSTGGIPLLHTHGRRLGAIRLTEVLHHPGPMLRHWSSLFWIITSGRSH